MSDRFRFRGMISASRDKQTGYGVLPFIARSALSATPVALSFRNAEPIAEGIIAL